MLSDHRGSAYCSADSSASVVSSVVSPELPVGRFALDGEPWLRAGRIKNALPSAWTTKDSGRAHCDPKD
jgi:hypothetical protein